MIVDDSGRRAWPDHADAGGRSGFAVVASVGNGQMAVSALERYDLEVVMLDIEMPVIDGMAALPLLLKMNRTFGHHGLDADAAKCRDQFAGACAGATDYIPKPPSSREVSGGPDFRRELIGKVRQFGLARRLRALHQHAQLPVTDAAASLPPCRFRSGTQPPCGERIRRRRRACW